MIIMKISRQLSSILDIYLPLEIHGLVIVSRSFSMLVIIIIQKYFWINDYKN